MIRKLFILLFIFITITTTAQVIDKIVAQIGDEIILSSDIETQYLQYLSQGYIVQEEVRCQIIEDLLYQKLLTHQAKLDSVDVTEEDVYKELERRLSSFIAQLGSQAALEEYFGKTIIEIKNEFYDIIYHQLLSQRMQSRITSSVSITPEEVKLFFQLLQDEGELPLIPTKIEMSQIVKIPEISFDEKSRIRKKLISFRDRINNGEDFTVLATLYSDDVESAKNGGSLGFVSRGDLLPEFESAAFALKVDEISEVIETKYGYHIIQLVERRGATINVRHILMKPKVSSSSLLEAKQELEKVEQLMNSGQLSFEEAAKNHSDDLSRNNGGLLINSKTGSSMFTLEELPSNIIYLAERMKEGDVSSISQFIMEDGTKAYRIIKITKKIKQHTANLEDDYTFVYESTLNIKKQEKIGKWVNSKVVTTYIRLEEELAECNLKKWQK